MKVCLDIQPALAQRAGIGRYTRMLAEHLVRDQGEDQLALFYFDFKRTGCDFAPEGVQQRAIRWIPGRVVQYAWKTLHAPPYDWFAGRADLFHFTNFIRYPLTKGRSVVTIHDASFMRHPETLEAKNYRYLMRGIRRTVERADAIITISRFTADELNELLGVPREKLHPIHCGLTTSFGRNGSEPLDVMKKRLGLDRPYLLSVGTIEPRKNFGFLIDLFDRLAFDGDLVIAGGRGWKNDGIFARREASPKRDRIRFLEYVSEADLPALYRGARLYVTPSLYEGFGFTPLEAMQCGTPVVAAAAGSLPEVLGDAAVLVKGFDPEVWVANMDQALANEDLRARCVARGREQVAHYSWEANAQATWKVYRSLA